MLISKMYKLLPNLIPKVFVKVPTVQITLTKKIYIKNIKSSPQSGRRIMYYSIDGPSDPGGSPQSGRRMDAAQAVKRVR